MWGGLGSAAPTGSTGIISEVPNVTSPLPAQAAGQVEVSEGSAHRCSRASLHPSRERRIWRQAPRGCSAPSASLCPAWASQGKENHSQILLSLHRGTEENTKDFCSRRDFRVDYRNPPLIAILQRGSVPGPAAKLSGGMPRASKHVRRWGPAW